MTAMGGQRESLVKVKQTIKASGNQGADTRCNQSHNLALFSKLSSSFPSSITSNVIGGSCGNKHCG